MKQKIVYYCIAAITVMSVLFVFYFGSNKEIDILNKEEDSMAPDGKPYGVSLNNIIYSPEYYDDEYGHFEDLVGEYFEPVKPAYYNEILFDGVVFPDQIDSTKYFPAFIALDAIDYTFIPEEVMNKYFTQEDMDNILYYEKNGIEVNGEVFHFQKDMPPIYKDIGVITIEPDLLYKVIYVTDKGSYINNFKIMEDGRVKKMSKEELENVSHE